MKLLRGDEVEKKTESNELENESKIVATMVESKEFAMDELKMAISMYVDLPSSSSSAPAGKPGGKGKGKGGGGGAGAAASKAAPTAPSYDRWNLLDDTTIDYGYLSKTGGVGIAEKSKAEDESYYITTAINYTNGPAHMGHAYEAATSDVIARFQRLKGTQPVYFVTGADEHGQKIANTATDKGKQPIEICNQVCLNHRCLCVLFLFCCLIWTCLLSVVSFCIFCPGHYFSNFFIFHVVLTPQIQYVSGFQCLNQRILISNDDYVRTTSDRHKRTAQELWKKCHANGDIYLDNYSGWYNIREETFVTDSDAALWEYKDPTSGVPLKKVEEASYFFKMSSYQDKLVQHIKSNPNFILPEKHRNQILARLTSDPLRDLSISRTTFDWGIPVPEGFEDKHVMYVWIDALSNYLTGVNGLGVNNDGNPTVGLDKFWPANVHIIGKDILWFHTVIWPCLLMSANIPLPKTVFAHGFVNDANGEKMSKSLGNVVDPHDMLDKFHRDTFRW